MEQEIEKNISKDKIPFYSNESFLEKIKKHNFDVAKKGKGEFKYNAAFIDLNTVREMANGKKIGIICNFRCPGCFKNLEQQCNPIDRLNFEEIKYIINFAKKRGAKAIVYAGLGEPMMDQDFWNALDYTYKKGMWTILFTNGTFITKENAKILYKKKVIVIIKINTLDRKKQDLMVGIKGASGRIMKGLNYLLSADFRTPRLVVESFMLKENAEDLKDLLRFCRKHKITPYFESFVTKTTRKKDYENRILSQKELDQLFLKLQKIDKKEFRINTKIVKGMRVYGQNPCLKYWTMFSVRNNGNVLLCISDNEIIGNIRKQPLEKILIPKNREILKRYKVGCNCSLQTLKRVEASVF